MVVVSDMQITCDLDLTGAAAGTWDVVVTNDDGQSATPAFGFRVQLGWGSLEAWATMIRPGRQTRAATTL